MNTSEDIKAFRVILILAIGIGISGIVWERLRVESAIASSFILLNLIVAFVSDIRSRNKWVLYHHMKYDAAMDYLQTSVGPYDRQREVSEPGDWVIKIAGCLVICTTFVVAIHLIIRILSGS